MSGEHRLSGRTYSYDAWLDDLFGSPPASRPVSKGDPVPCPDCGGRGARVDESGALTYRPGALVRCSCKPSAIDDAWKAWRAWQGREPSQRLILGSDDTYEIVEAEGCPERLGWPHEWVHDRDDPVLLTLRSRPDAPLEQAFAALYGSCGACGRRLLKAISAEIVPEGSDPDGSEDDGGVVQLGPWLSHPADDNPDLCPGPVFELSTPDSGPGLDGSGATVYPLVRSQERA